MRYHPQRRLASIANVAAVTVRAPSPRISDGTSECASDPSPPNKHCSSATFETTQFSPITLAGKRGHLAVVPALPSVVRAVPCSPNIVQCESSASTSDRGPAEDPCIPVAGEVSAVCA